MTLLAILPSTLQLLRFHFSLVLMPVYWFALSQLRDVNLTSALLVFVILHLFVYPASNGYNSYMDKDQESIGGIRHPMQPTRQLFFVTLAMDIAALLISCLINLYFAAGVLAYILASRAYSYRGIRLKKYPVAGYLTVVCFQGAYTFALVYMGCNADDTVPVSGTAMLVASLLIGGFYPLTQIYQHQPDLNDGVKTISYRLGYRGTFIFCGIIFTSALSVLGYFFHYTGQPAAFYCFSICMMPVAGYFFVWARKVWQNSTQANFKHAMRMNVIASTCSNLAFILIFIFNHLE